MQWLGLLPGLVAGIAPIGIPLGPSGSRPGARGSAVHFAFPLVRWVRQYCDLANYPGAVPEEEEVEYVRGMSRALQSIENASGHLHWRFVRTGWLLGSISAEHLGPALLRFVSAGVIGDVAISMWQGLCRQALSQTRAFYTVWLNLLQAVGFQDQPTEYGTRMWETGSAMSTYWLRKEATQPTYLQEQQLAILFRSVVAINSGAAASPCTCQLFYYSLLRESVTFWGVYFKPRTTELGSSGDDAWNAQMETLDEKLSPCQLMKVSPLFLVPFQELVMPEMDQVLGDFACLPKRIVTAMVCGQYWMHKGDAATAKECFNAASQMLVMSMDCFDHALQSFISEEVPNSRWLQFQEMYAYMSQIDTAVRPFHVPRDLIPKSAAMVSREPQPRSLRIPVEHSVMSLPPLCLHTNSSELHLRVQGIPQEQKLFIYDFTGAWSLHRVHLLQPLDLKSMDYTGHKVVFVGADVPAWTNLGHALDRLVTVVFGTYRHAYLSGGMAEVLKLRESLEVHVRFSEQDSRDLGFEVNHSASVWQPPVMLPFLTLLSSRPARLLSELPADRINASALQSLTQARSDGSFAPALVQRMSAGKRGNGTCYSGGFWCSRNGPLTAPELRLFRVVATQFPFWGGRSKQELLSEVWGLPKASAPAVSADPCLEIQSRSCLRVLIIRRGSLARSRAIVNLDDASRWAETSFPSSEVRIAVVQMEQFSIGEEIALAELTDIFIGAYGSAMWWPVFMAAGCCAMWLYPLNAQLGTGFTQKVLTTRLWSKRATLEYLDLVDLRHVYVPGGTPPPGTPGNFSLPLQEERSDRLAFQRLDIFLDLAEFGRAFKEAVSEQRTRLTMLAGEVRSPRVQRRVTRPQVDGTERLKKARSIRQPWLRDLIEGLWIARRTVLGIASVLVALGLWLAQHEETPLSAGRFGLCLNMAAGSMRFSRLDESDRQAGQELEESPLQEVPLSVLHKRASPLNLSHQSLAHGLDSARRLDALEWLVQAFDALDLADEQLFSAIGLLDRFAANATAPIAAGPGAFALVLAVMLVALKVSGFKKDLERARRLVVEVSGSSRPWAAVRKAEFSILRRLGFRACTPTAFDLLDRLLSDLFPSHALRLGNPSAGSGPMPSAGTDPASWDPESKLRCGNLARFLLEMCVVYDPEALYGSGRPPLVSAVAALLLSLLSHSAPRHYAQMMAEAVHLTESNRTTLMEIAEAMRSRWVMEEQKNGANGSVVLEKWRRRSGAFEVSPPSPYDLRALTSGITMGAPVKAEPARSYAPAKAPGSPTRARRLTGAAEVLSALPTPARRAPGGQRTEATATAAASSTKNPLGQGQQGLPAPRLTQKPPKEESYKQPAKPQEEEARRQQENHRPPRLSAPQEPLAFWPMQTGPQGAGTAAEQPAEPLVEPEPLLELTHVLNMVAPRPQIPPPSGGVSNTSKLQTPSVAADLLVQSALRMQWPADKRKLAPKDAASTCREAAGVLQEAINQLSSAANVLECGGSGVREVAKTYCAETKRRKTYAGPAVPGAVSPPVGGSGSGSTVSSLSRAPAVPAVYRGSPPMVRTTGLRV
ncbi:unnamed protein product [Symbiodinium sp. CCMP2456]|nr:unnamed protein product [Symbiodinium sp. CCMP2456]